MTGEPLGDREPVRCRFTSGVLVLGLLVLVAHRAQIKADQNVLFTVLAAALLPNAAF